MFAAVALPLARRIAVAGFAATLIVGSALAAGPFGEFAGAWHGSGKAADIHGKTETLSCKSSNSPSSDGIAMSLSLVCASDSYRVDFHADLYTDGTALRGTWTETTRQATGEIKGSITPDLINATASAPGFSASVAIKVLGGKRLEVDLNAQGTTVNHVVVTMKR
jgi:hypothetical protein